MVTVADDSLDEELQGQTIQPYEAGSWVGLMIEEDELKGVCSAVGQEV